MRLIGDSRATDLYQYPIDQWEAQELAEIEHRHNDLLNNVTPKVVFSNRHTIRRKGICKNDGTIILNPDGQNLGALAHELAHLSAAHEKKHGYYFKEAHLSILDSFEDYAKGRKSY